MVGFAYDFEIVFSAAMRYVVNDNFRITIVSARLPRIEKNVKANRNKVIRECNRSTVFTFKSYDLLYMKIIKLSVTNY